MRIDYKYKDNILVFEFYPEEDELVGKKVTWGNCRCEFGLPAGLDINKIHPDVMALSMILIIYPFASSKIQLPFGISRYFADALKQLIKKDVYPIDEMLEKNTVTGNSKIALAYSGGVDSTAAVALLPDNTVLYFIDRKIPEGTKSMYSKDAPYHACDVLREEGRTVYNIPTDFEYVRNPLGFPVDVACGVPGLLLSAHENVDSIAMGMVMESAYRIGHENYEDYAKRWHYKVWGGVFAAVGIPLNLVVAGLSEVGTESIVLRSSYKDIAQSCMRAVGGKPCMKCMKCLRKRLLEGILNKGELEQAFLEQFFKSKGVQKLLMTSPMKHQNVLIYITSHYQGDYEPMLLLKKKMGGDIKNVDWVEKWYSPSIVLIPNQYQQIIEENIMNYLEKMTPEECKEVEAWDLHGFLASEAYAKVSEAFFEILKTL